MAASDHLWLLIHHLEKGEVDRFRKVFKHKKEDQSHFVQLFEDLLALSSYKEKEFRQANQSKGYIRSLPQLKRYLYDQVLDVLRSSKKPVKEDNPPEFVIRELMEEAIILRSKMLFDQGLERLEKAFQTAKAQEFMELMLEILKMKRRHHNESPGKDYQSAFPKLLVEIREVGEAIAWNARIIALRDAIFFANRLGLPIDDETHTVVVEAKRDLANMKVPQTKSLEVRINYHVAKALWGHWIKDINLAWHHYRAVYLLWKANPEFRNARRSPFLKAVNNYLTTGIAAGKDADFVEAFQHLEKSGSGSADEKAEAKQNAAYVRLQYYLSACDWDNCLAMEKEFNQKPSWVTVKMKQPRLLAFYLSFARFHLVHGKFKETARYAGYVQDEPGSRQFANRLAEAKLLELLVEIESHPDMVPENAIRNTDRFLIRHRLHTPFSKALVNALGHVFDKPEDARQRFWDNSREVLDGLINPSNYDSGEYFLIQWVTAKARGVSFKEMLESGRR